MRCKWGLGSNKDRGPDPSKKGTTQNELTRKMSIGLNYRSGANANLERQNPKVALKPTFSTL